METKGSRAADRLAANKERVLELWIERMRKQVASTAGVPRLVLIDTLPALLRQLAEALSPRHPRRTATEGSTIAEEHGGERVRITPFRLEDVILEYKLLREVIIEVLEEGEPLRDDERSVLHASIDQAVAKSCTAYVAVQEALREQVFATLAHDLRGPLSTSRMNMSLILRTPSSEHVTRWAVKGIDALDRVDHMVQGLLDAMRAQAGGRLPLELEECDLVEVVKHGLEQLQEAHGDHFVLAAPEPVIGHFAPAAVQRAVVNLGNNAIKYGDSGRKISVTVRKNNGRAFIVVHNHGSYIPADQQPSLFRAFHRLPSAEASDKRGWGLGLVQVRGVAESHGGSIGVDSLPERGTSFTIDIPLDARPFQEKPVTPMGGGEMGSERQ
jgi:signal transduction histidine kinase